MNEIERAIKTIAELEEAYKLRLTNGPVGPDPLYDIAVDRYSALKAAGTALREQAEREKNPGEASDGYHTFNELYHHRAVLFSVICNAHTDIAWKAKRHHDGTMYDGMFIVGIETPDGQATYHYDINPYWDMFRVPELSRAPEWDGHTPAQAIERIGRLEVKQT